MVKKIIALLLAILLSVTIFASCTKRSIYEVDYPEQYTPEYCRENYVRADPNLVHLSAAENSIGSTTDSGFTRSYYAIKGVPLDKYLFVKETGLMYQDHEVYRSKELKEQEILSFECQSVELFWSATPVILLYHSQNKITSDQEQQMWANIGQEYVQESITILSSTIANNLQAHILEFLNTGNFEGPRSMSNVQKHYTNEYGVQTFALLCIRVSFSEYPNLVWDALIRKADKNYYMYFYWWTADEFYPEGYYKIIRIPLPEDIAKLIPET